MTPRRTLTLCCAALLVTTTTTAAAAAAAAATAGGEQPQVPAEVVVSSDPAYVKGSSRADRLLSGSAKKGITVLGDDGIPVVYGVRVHETEEERNEPVWRNARVIGNKLFSNDETPPPLPPPPHADALTDQKLPATEQSAVRQGRILSYNSGAQFGFNRGKSTTLPPYYYKSYYGSKQRPTAAAAPSRRYQYPAQQSVHGQSQGLNVVQAPSVSGGSRRPSVGQYSGQGSAYAQTSPQPAATTAATPVYQAYLDTGFSQPVSQRVGLQRPADQLEYSYTPENKLQHSYSPEAQADVYYSAGSQQASPQPPAASYQAAAARPAATSTYQQTVSQSGIGPYQRPTATRRPPAGDKSQFERRFQAVPTQSSSGGFRFPSASSGGASGRPAGQILSPGSYNLPQAATDFQNTVDPFSGRPVNPDQFKIKQMSFQSVPGGPIVNIPVPIPHGQHTKKPSRKPNRRFSFLDGLFGGGSKRPAKDRFSATAPSSAPSAFSPTAASSPAYYNSDPYEYDQNGFRKPTLYDTITDPIRKLGENVIEFTKPVTQPFRDATDRLTEELGLSSPVPTDLPADKQAGGGEALLVGGLVAGAGALAGLSFLVYANTVNNNTHYIIGRRRRSLEDHGPAAILENLVEGEDGFQAEFLSRLRQEGFQRWSRGPCAKRIFCDFMTQQDSTTVASVARRVTTFLSYLDRGEPDGLMAQARQLTKAIERRECALFSCGGDTVDPSRIAVDASPGSNTPGDTERRPVELLPR